MKKYLLLSLLIFLTSCTPNLTGNTVLSLVQDQGDIELYFCPQDDCEQELTDFIDSAQESIHCAFFEVDLDKVRNKLLEKQKYLDVKVITDQDYLYEFDHDFVKVDSWGLMHNNAL